MESIFFNPAVNETVSSVAQQFTPSVIRPSVAVRMTSAICECQGL